MFEDLFDEDGGTDTSIPEWALSSSPSSSSASSSSSMYRPDRPHDSYAGLLNQGATCYMNSLIQSLYLTPEVREAIYAIPLEELLVRGGGNSAGGDASVGAGGVSQQSPPASSDSTKEGGADGHGHSATESIGFGSAALSDAHADSLAELLMFGFDRDVCLAAIRKFPHYSANINELRIDWILNSSSASNFDDGATAPAVDAEGFLQDDFNYYDQDTTPPVMTALFDDIVQESDTNKSADTNSTRTSQQKPEPQSAPKEPEQQHQQQNVSRRIPFELQRLFARLQAAHVKAVSTEDLTSKGFGWVGNDTRIQHDVHELNRVLFDAIERSLKGSGVASDLINALYRGSMAHQVKCLECGRVNTRLEQFLDLSLPVLDYSSILDSLNHVFTPELLTGSNQYRCDTCNKKVDASIGVAVDELPRVLVLSLARFEYDVQKDDRIKNTRRLEYPMTLSMQPYTIASKSGNEGALSTTETAASASASASTYDLFAVIIHRGSTAQFGHYHAYIKDVLPPLYASQQQQDSEPYEPDTEVEHREGFPQTHEGWLDFDDSSVTPIPTSKLLKQFGGSSECAYMLIYRRRDLPVVPRSALTIPDHCAEEVKEWNELLAVETAEAQRKARLITINVSVPRHYRVSTSSSHLGETVVKVAPHDGEATPPTRVSISIDRQSTLRDLKAQIIEKFSADDLPPQLRLDLLRVRSDSVTIIPDSSLSLLSQHKHDGNVGDGDVDGCDDTTSLEVALQCGADTRGGAAFEVLVWNGVAFVNNTDDNGGDDMPLAPRLHLRVRYLPSTDDVTRFSDREYVVRENMSLNNLRMWIANETLNTITSATSADAATSTFTQPLITRLGINKITPFAASDWNQSIFQVFERDLDSVVPLTLEFIPASSASSSSSSSSSSESSATDNLSALNNLNIDDTIAARHCIYRKSLMELFIVNGATRSTCTVQVQRQATVRELKGAIVREWNVAVSPTATASATSGDYDASRLQLRRTLMGDSPGELLSDDNISLKEAGINEFQRLWASHNEPSSSASSSSSATTSTATDSGIVMPIRFVLGHNRKRRLRDEVFHIRLQEDWKIRTVITKMIEMLIMAEVVKKETVGDVAYRLYTTDVMWETPAKVLDNLDLKVKHVSPLIDDDCLLWLEEGPVPVPGAIIVHIDLRVLDMQSTFAPSPPSDIFSQMSLFTLEISKFESILSLKEAILKRLADSHDDANSAVSALATASTTTTTPASLRVYYHRKLLRSDASSLKSYKIEHDSTVSIQIMPPSSSEKLLPSPSQESGLLLYIRQRDPNIKGYLPPQEVWWNFGMDAQEQQQQSENTPPQAQNESTSSTMKGRKRNGAATSAAATPVNELALRAYLSSYVNIPEEHLLLLRALPHGKWRNLSAPSIARVNTHTNTSLSASSSKLWLTDSDVLVYMDLRSDLAGNDYFELEEYHSRHSAYSDYPDGADRGDNNKKRARAPEIALKIDVNIF